VSFFEIFFRGIATTDWDELELLNDEDDEIEVVHLQHDIV
jgi:hypothetical protein